MPGVSGFQVITQVKAKISAYNAMKSQLLCSPRPNSQIDTTERHNVVFRPLICYYTQYDHNIMSNFITRDEEADYYL